MVKVIGNISCPLILGTNFRLAYAEDPATKKWVNLGSQPKRTVFFRTSKKKTRSPNMTKKGSTHKPTKRPKTWQPRGYDSRMYQVKYYD